MSDPIAAAIDFEAVKVAMSQTKDGIKITLVIHPNDNTNELFSDHVGSRYKVVMVLLDDEDQPAPRKTKTDAERAVTAAVMLCKDPDFQKWMVDNNNALEVSEEGAISGLQMQCGIKSRSELRTDPEARRRFDALRLAFSKTR